LGHVLIEHHQIVEDAHHRPVGTAPVASSCIDIEAGLSKCDMISTPRGFCASATGAASATDNAHAAANPPRFDLIAYISPQPLVSLQEL